MLMTPRCSNAGDQDFNLNLRHRPGEYVAGNLISQLLSRQQPQEAMRGRGLRGDVTSIPSRRGRNVIKASQL